MRLIQLSMLPPRRFVWVDRVSHDVVSNKQYAAIFMTFGPLKFSNTF